MLKSASTQTLVFTRATYT